jgi:hypothetical protein
MVQAAEQVDRCQQSQWERKGHASNRGCYRNNSGQLERGKAALRPIAKWLAGRKNKRQKTTEKQKTGMLIPE